MPARLPVLAPALLIVAGLGLAQPPSIGSCPVFPADHIWNTAVDQLAVSPNSAAWVATIGASSPLHPDFGSGLYNGGPIGIPFVTVPGSQTKYPAVFTYQSESDPGPYAIPLNAPIEGGSGSSGDRHAIAIDAGNCILYEIYSAYPQASSWQGGSGAIFSLSGYALRPATWTSADAAGLPIFPGLVRYDEIAAGAINHAIRFTVPQTQKAFVWPARHYASSLTGAQYPPMGARFRLKAGFDISGFSATNQIILRALKKYGMMLADNGSAWFISGAPDPRWNNDDLHVLTTISGANFEAVDVASLMIDPNSGQAVSGSSCSFSLSTTSVQASVAGGTSSVNIQTGAGCAWSVTNLPAWITLSGAGSGSGPAGVTLVIAANSGAARNATITIAGISVPVTQLSSSACAYSISPSGQGFSAAGGSATVGITADPGCAWTAGNVPAWVTLTSAGSGSGNGTLSYSAGANSGAARSIALTVASLNYTIEQAASSIAGFSPAGSMGQVTAGGGWSTSITLINPGISATQLRLNFSGDDGNPLALNLTFPQSGEGPLVTSMLDRTLAPGAILELTAAGPGDQPSVEGWAQLLASGPVNGFLTLRYTAGSLDHQALVPLEISAAAYLLAFDNTNGFVAGIAIANTSLQNGNIGITIRDDTGATVFSSTLALAALTHTSFVLSDRYGFTAGMRGSVELNPPAGVAISVTGLQYNTATGGFSTIPALTP